jgi:amidase
VLAVLDGARRALERLGCVTEEVDPPLDGADEAFETLRAHQFELGWGEQFDRAGERMKATVRWNIEAGRALSVPT